MGARKSTEQVIPEFRKKHGDNYDYSKVDYVKSNQKIIIICKTHGEFLQAPAKHLMGRACPKCAGEKTSLRFKSNTENFVKKAKQKHGKTYDYSLVEYDGNSKDVKIICFKHGVFNQRPGNHLNGSGCGKCGDERVSINSTRTKEEFVLLCNEVHDGKYDYEITRYTNCKDKIKVTCKKHGIFEIIADNHKCGQGCVACYKEDYRQNAKENFIKKAKEIFDDIYDYSLVNYETNQVKVKIICQQHGEFEQMPLNHLQGNGCNKCNLQKRNDNKTKTSDFVLRVLEVHSSKYNYDTTCFINWDTKIEINCPEHGYFLQYPSAHLKGVGCQKCGIKEISKKLRSTTSKFIESAVKKHGDKYDYSLVDYTHSRDSIKIICKDHGVFEQRPVDHLKGSGCQNCALLINVYKREDYIKLSEKALIYVILLENEDEKFYKIGKTKNTVQQRFSSEGTADYKYTIVSEYYGDSGDIYDLEIYLHKKYFKYKYIPKNSFAGRTECYTTELPVKELFIL